MAKKATKKIEGDVLTIAFEETDQNLTADLNAIPPEIVQRLAMHGLSQKLGDSYAGVEAAEAFDRASGVLEDLTKGEWSTRVAAAGPRSTQLAEALSGATGKALEECVQLLDVMDDDQKTDLKKHPQIKAELARIKAANAAKAAEKAASEAAGDVPPLTI